MRTLSRLGIAAGIIGTIAGTSAAPALAQGVYLEGPGFGHGIKPILAGILFEASPKPL